MAGKVRIDASLNVSNVLTNASALGRVFNQLGSDISNIDMSNIANLAPLIGRAIAAFGAIAAVRGTIRFIEDGVNRLHEFEQAMRNVNTIAKLNEEDFQKFSDKIRDLNYQLGATTTAADAAGAAYDIVSAGFTNAADASKILNESIIAGAAGLSDTKTAAKTMVGLMNAYGLSANDAGHVSDVLFATIEKGVTTYSDLAKTLGRAAPTARRAGVSLEDLTASVAVLTKQGITTREAVTGLKRGLTALIAPTDNAQKAMEKYGLTSKMVSDSLKSRGLGETIKWLREAVNDDADALRKLFGEATALNAAFALTENMDTYRDALDATTDSLGASADAFEEQAKGMEFQMKQLRVQADELKMKFGELFEPLAEGAVSVAKNTLEGLNYLMDRGPVDTYSDAIKTLWNEMNMLQQTGLLLVTAFPLIIGGFVLFTKAAASSIFTVAGLKSAIDTLAIRAMYLADAISLSTVAFGAFAAAAVVVGYHMYQATKAIEEGTAAQEKNLKTFEQLTKALHGPGREAFRQHVREIKDMSAAELKLSLANDEMRKTILETADAQLDVINGQLMAVEGAKRKQLLEERQKWIGIQAIAKKADEEISQIKKDSLNKEVERRKAAAEKIQEVVEQIDSEEISSTKDKLKALQDVYKKYGNLVDEGTQKQIKRKIGKLNKKVNQEDIADAKKAKDDKLKIKEAEIRKAKALGKDALKDEIEVAKEYREMAKGDAVKYAQADAKVAELQAAADKKAEQEKRHEATETVKHKLALYDRMRREGKISFDQEAQRIKQLSKLANLEASEREQLLLKAQKVIEQGQDEALTKQKAKLRAEKFNTDKELAGMDRKKKLLDEEAEVGLKTQEDYKKYYRERIALEERQAKLKVENLKAQKDADPAEIAQAEKQLELDLQAIREEGTKKYLESINALSEAKKKANEETEKQIQKEKELLDLLKGEMSGTVMTLDQFFADNQKRAAATSAKDFNFTNLYESGTGNSLKDKRKALFEKRRKEKDAYGQLFGNDKPGVDIGVTPGVGTSMDAVGEKMGNSASVFANAVATFSQIINNAGQVKANNSGAKTSKMWGGEFQNGT